MKVANHIISVGLAASILLTGCGGGGGAGDTTSSATSNSTSTVNNPSVSTSPVNNPSVLTGGNIQGNALTLTGVTSQAATGFTSLGHITTDGTNIYATDAGVVQKIDPATGSVTLLLGAQGTCTATLCNAKGITTDGMSLYVVDTQGRIIKIDIATGANSVLTTGLSMPTGAITTDNHNLYVAELSGIKIIPISTSTAPTWGASSVLNTVQAAQDITTDGINLYFINGNAIQKADIATGAVTNLAGAVGVVGSTDGVGGAASFRMPWAIATDGTNLYVTQYNSGIRKIAIASATVTTLIYPTLTDAYSGTVTDGRALYYANGTLNKMQ